MSTIYPRKNDGVNSIPRPNKEQIELLKDYAIYCAKFLEMSPIMHEEDQKVNYRFLLSYGFLESTDYSGQRWVNITPQGQSFARALGIKLDCVLAPPKCDRYEISKYVNM